MTELITVKISDLKENNTFSELVPEMTTTEYQDLVKSIKKHGVRQPIHILTNKTILDGRHRVRACKEIGVIEVQAVVHGLSNNEAIEFVVDTAIERRNLSKEQKVDIVLRSSELIKVLEEEAQLNKERGQFGNKEQRLGSAEPDRKRTNERIGEMTGTSKATVVRMKKVKNEDPELYEKVVAGEESAFGAYYKLPSVQQPKPKPKQEPKPKPKLVIPEPEPTDPEELKLLVAVENLEFNMNQIIGYVDDHQEKLYEAICQMFEEKNDFMNQAKKSIEVIDNLMNAYLGGNKNE